MKIQASTKVLAVILAAATAATPSVASAAPLSSIFHLHPRTNDSRVSFVIYNEAYRDCKIRIAGKVYNVEPHRALTVTAPVGTQIYAASDTRSAKAGSMLHEVTPRDESQRVVLD
jgi:hypothetical protein